MLLLNNAEEGSEKKEKELRREKRLICGILLIFLRGGSSFGLGNNSSLFLAQKGPYFQNQAWPK